MTIQSISMNRITVWALSLILFTAIASAQKPDRSSPPQLGPPPFLHLNDIQRFTLSNGLSIVLYEKHDVPLVEVNLIVNSGSVNDPAGKPGVASMTAALMTEGAGARSALDVADAAEFLGAELRVTSGLHSMIVAMNVPSEQIDSALALFADVALRPSFPQAELDRKRAERLTSYNQWRDEPRMLASILFNRSLFGATHPYGIPQVGTQQSITLLTVGDLKDFHGKNFTPLNSAAVVVGDVTPKTLIPRLEKLFGKWKGAKPEQVKLPVVPQVQGKTILLVDKPGAAQTEIRIGRIGAQRLTPDYYDLIVMNSILGGSFSSRLNQNLRETHGYTYGASSRFDFRPEPGPFVAGAGVQTAVTDSALVEFLKELRSIGNGVTEKELGRAKNYVALGYPADFQSVSSIASQLNEAVIYNLPPTFFNTYIEKILQVNKDGVDQAARKYIDPEKLLIVLVGDRAQIEQKVAALNIAPVTVVPVDDVLAGK
jgi:predicted Zn-dependent peptidase